MREIRYWGGKVKIVEKYQETYRENGWIVILRHSEKESKSKQKYVEI